LFRAEQRHRMCRRAGLTSPSPWQFQWRRVGRPKTQRGASSRRGGARRAGHRPRSTRVSAAIAARAAPVAVPTSPRSFGGPGATAAPHAAPCRTGVLHVSWTVPGPVAHGSSPSIHPIQVSAFNPQSRFFVSTWCSSSNVFRVPSGIIISHVLQRLQAWTMSSIDTVFFLF